MLPEIRDMLRLQELDGEILKLQQALGAGSARLDQLKKEEQSRHATMARLEQQASALAPKRRQLEVELSGREQQLAKYRKQIDMVRTPKEADAINHELDNANADVARLEESILELMEQEEKAQADLKEKRATVERMTAKFTEEQDRILLLHRENEALLKVLKEDRVAAAGSLPEDVLGSYEWLLNKYGPTAIVTLSGQACGGCGGIVVPHVCIQVGQGTELLQCNLCRRYLYADPAKPQTRENSAPESESA
jgi:uncharacterized protein